YVTLRGAAGVAVVDALTLQQIDVGAAPSLSARGGLPHVEADATGLGLDPALRFATLIKPTDIFGTAKLTGASPWKLLLFRFGSATPMATLGENLDSVDSARLATLDPNAYTDGTYLLRLTIDDGSQKPPKVDVLVELQAHAKSREIKLPTGTM